MANLAKKAKKIMALSAFSGVMFSAYQEFPEGTSFAAAFHFFEDL